LQELESLSGAEFEAAYIEAQVMAHEEALTLMQDYAENGEDEALKAHAAKVAPIIEQHHQEAQQLESGT
jgi:putative membrane protein